MTKKEQIATVKVYIESVTLEAATKAEVESWCFMYETDQVSEAQFKISIEIFLQVNLF